MKRFLLVVGGCVAALALMAALPGPRTRIITARFAVAPDSTVVAGASVTVSGTWIQGDQIRFNFWKDNTLVATQDVAALTISGQTMPAPAYGATSEYWVCARYKRGTRLGDPVCSLKWAYTRPEAPLPTINGVEILPSSATVPSSGGSLQFSVQGS